MSSTIPYNDIGKQAKELLAGSKQGIFQYDQKVTVNAKPGDDMTVVVNALSRKGALALDLKGTLKKAPLTVEVLQAAGKPKVTMTLAETLKSGTPLDGLKLSVAASHPKPVDTAKATLEFAKPHFHTKTVIGVAPTANMDISATAGYQGFTVGGQMKVLLQQNPALDKWSLAGCYTGERYVLAAQADTGFATVKGTYWQQLDAANSVAAEVVHKPRDEEATPTLAMGYSHVDSAGTLTKIKVGQDAMVHLHRSVKVDPATSVAVSACLNLYESTAPKVGFSVEHNP